MFNTLAAGSRLGAYEISSRLGEGGLGQVYRARDTKLDREVALKILPESFASDPDRLVRFEREAKTLASLNHPHIAQVYGLEDSGVGSQRALVMELVDGEDLAARLKRSPIGLDDTTAIARQIPEAAHVRGIVHRDLKPANIKVRADGAVKGLDFGLAKAFTGAPSSGSVSTNLATITSPAVTMPGMLLGTAASMSPELRLSANGKWLAYNAANSGRAEVYVSPVPPTGKRLQMSVDGGTSARWRDDGGELYYLAPDGTLMAVATPTRDTRLDPGRPVALFKTGIQPTQNLDHYAVGVDGKTFLLRLPVTTTEVPTATLIANWLPQP